MYHKSNLPLRPAYVINTYQHSRTLNPHDTIRSDPRRRETGLPAAPSREVSTCFRGHRARMAGKKKKKKTTKTRRRREKTRPTRAFRRRIDGAPTTNVQSLMKKEKLDGSGDLGVPLLPAATRWPLFGQQARTFHRVKSSAAGQLRTRPCGEQKKAKRKSTFLRLGGRLCSPRPCICLGAS